MEIINFQKIDKGAVVAKLDLKFDNFGMTIRDCLIMKSSKTGGMFVSMPARAYEKEGKKQYFSYILWEKERKSTLDKEVLSLCKEMIEAESPNDTLF